jgi:hypothetical protein
MKKIIISCLIISGLTYSCQLNEAQPDKLKEGLSTIENISIFADLMQTTGKGLLDINQNKTLFIPTDEAFRHYDVAEKRDYDKAAILAFLAYQMTDNPLAATNFKSGKLTTSNGLFVRVYDGREFTQIEESLVEKTDLKLGNLTVHLVDRIFKPETLIGHDHNTHASGHAHGGTHNHSMENNCGSVGPDKKTKDEVIAFRNQTSKFLATLPNWSPTSISPRNLPGGFALMGGRTDGLPYVHYFSKQNMEDGKFMNPNAPEGLMCGLTADGVVYPISAVYMTREASAQQLHNLNCMFMFHEHDGLPGVMMHYFHDAYPSTNYGLDHEAEPALVRKMKAK